MNRAKYLILNGYLDDQPVIFPTSISHEAMAQALVQMGEPISAGFVDDVEGELSAHGHSHSLNLNSRPEDSDLLNRLVFGG